MTFGERLRAERKRLKMNQTQLAALADTTKASQINYEKDVNSPSAAYLAAIAAAGIDVMYILTEQRGELPLTPEERQLLALFRGASLPAKAAAVAALAAGNTYEGMSGNVTVQGNVNGGVVAHTYNAKK